MVKKFMAGQIPSRNKASISTGNTEPNGNISNTMPMQNNNKGNMIINKTPRSGLIEEH